MKKYFTLIAAAILPLLAAAQFKVTENNGNETTTPGNLYLSHPSGGNWQVMGIDINNISSIERIARTGAIELDRQLSADGEPNGMYFADTYQDEDKKGIGNYYFLITNDEAASVNGTTIAGHPGGYVLYLDMLGPLSANHANAILPEGTYICTNDKAMYTTNLELTWASLNSDGTVGGIKQIYPTEGSVEVRHVDSGYEITANFLTEDNENISFHFVGALSFNDTSGITDDDNTDDEQ